MSFNCDIVAPIDIADRRGFNFPQPVFTLTAGFYAEICLVGIASVVAPALSAEPERFRPSVPERKLEHLRDDLQRQSIRNDADLRIVEFDIAGLLEKEAVEMAKLEGKIREAEKLRADLRIARIRAIEQARAILTTDQKKKLEDLTGAMHAPRPPRAGQNSSAT